MHLFNAGRLTSALLALVVASGAQAAAQAADYSPVADLAGVIRIAGPAEAAPLIQRWEQAFLALQPDVRFANSFKGATNAQFALQEETADLAVLDRYLGTVEVQGLYRRRGVYETTITVARASYEGRGGAQPLVLYVNKKNPLATLSQHQLTRVFKARMFGERRQYDGGLQWQVDDNHDGRGLGTNYIYITNWRELGLSGDWADKPINVYGPPLASPGWISPLYTGTGGDMWTERYTEIANPADIVAAVAKDPYGIARTSVGYATSDVRMLPLPDLSGDANLDRPPPPPNVHYGPGPRAGYLDPAQQTFPLMIGYAPRAGAARAGLSPASEAFLNFLLSRAGQDIANRVAKFSAVSGALAAKGAKSVGVYVPRPPLDPTSSIIPHLNATIDGMRPGAVPGSDP